MDNPNDEIVESFLEDAVRNAVSYYGIEGCEEAIKRVYTQHPTVKARFLATFHRIYIEK